jgi:FAD/FMN-containing dehydrogenase
MIEINRLTEIVGSDNVSCGDLVRDEYAKDMSFVNGVRPTYVVRPRNSAEVRSLVRLANEFRTPLIPVSSGAPHFHGDTVPSVAESTVMDLSGMKRIIRVDRQNRVAMCEPGVTFEDMIAAAEKEGLRLNMPLLPRKTKSLVASLLEREPVTMPKYHWDISDPIACMEVVFGTGDVFRTGEAAGPGTLEEQWAGGGAQKEAAGPSQISWHRVVQGSQGTMGIVTWASMRCELLPRLEEPFWAGSTRLDKVMEMAQSLIKLRLVNECFVLNNVNLATMLPKKASKEMQISRDSLPPYILFFNIAGYDYLPDVRVDGQIKDMQSTAQKLGIEPQRSLGKIAANEFLALIRRPSEDPYWKLRAKGSSQDIFFISNYDQLSNLVEVMNRVAVAEGYPVSDMGIYIQPIVQGVNYHCEFNLPYDPENQAGVERVRRLMTCATKELMAHGAFFSRPYGENTGMIINRDAGTVWALKKVKNILDPNGIMNPGKLCF